jgi:MGT family glycosyltransferase
MKAIYYNIFGLGHINPTLPVVQALTESGVEIIYHSSPERRELIEASGATFINYGYDDYKASDFNPGQNFVLQTIPATVGLLPFLTEEFERVRPDFILYDSMAIWGYVIGLIYNIPAFCTVTTFALSEEAKNEMFKKHGVVIDETNVRSMEYLKEKYDIELSLSQCLGAYGKHNIVFTSKDFNPPMEENFLYAGVMLKSNQENTIFLIGVLKEVAKNKKIITMAFGTILLKQDPELLCLYKKLIEAFADDANYQLVLGVSSEENVRALGELPANTLAFPHIPQVEVLKYTDCFISHGGMNSINEALHFGVPLVLIPYSNDQFGNSKQVNDLRLGIELKKEAISTESLRQAVLTVLDNVEIQRNVKLMSKSFTSCQGLDGIVNYIKDNLFFHKSR